MKVAFARSLATLILATWLAVFGYTGAAQAHPHMFFGATAQFVLDSKGRLAKLRVVFLVDELNTIYTLAELGVNKDGDETLTDDETAKVARTILEGFGHYGYFTHLRSQTGAIALAKPLSVTVQIQQRRLGLAFIIPLERPLDLKGQSLALQLYDPTYFTAVTIDLAPTLVGGGADCSVAVTKPADTAETRTSQRILSQLSREQTPQREDVGAIFAETTRLTCRQ